MRTARSLVIAVSAVLLVFSAVGRAHAQEDTIWTRNARYEERVQIVSETYEFVKFKVAGALQIERTEDVVKVVHGSAPRQFLLAEQARADHRWDRALGLYRNVAKTGRADWVKAYCGFYIGECLRSWGTTEPARLKEAVKAYEQFVSDYAKHRFVPHALWGEVLAAGDAGLRAKEKAACDKLAADTYGKKWGIRGRFGSVRASFRKGEPVSPDPLSRLANDARREGMTDIWAGASMLLARVLQKSGKTSQAQAAIQTVLADPKGVPKELLAEAHNMLGDCYLKSGAPEGAKKALFEHLKVLVLYSGVHAQYLEALKKAITLLEKLGGEEYVKRAKELRKEYDKALKSRGH